MEKRESQGSPQMDRGRGDFLYCRSRNRQGCVGHAPARPAEQRGGMRLTVGVADERHVFPF